MGDAHPHLDVDGHRQPRVAGGPPQRLVERAAVGLLGLHGQADLDHARVTLPAPDLRRGALDVVGVVGPNAGKTFPSIFALQGDTLTICYDMSGTARPTEFVSPPGTMILLARYVRSKS